MKQVFGLVGLLFLTGCQGGGGEGNFYNDQGIEALGQDRYDEAQAAFEKALEINPKDGVVWGNLGVALTRLERYEEALEAYQKSNELVPDDPITVAEIASIHYRERRFQEAKAGFEEAIRLETRAPEFHSSLSLALLQLGEKEAAQKELDGALPQARKRGLVQYHHAAFMLITGEIDTGLTLFETSLEAYPAGARSAVSDPDFEPVYDHPHFQKLVGGWWKPVRSP